ncbi:10626_t:CDS:2, partial [Cetraspora pellucida]
MNPQPIQRLQNIRITVNSTNNANDIDQRYTELIEGVKTFSGEQRVVMINLDHFYMQTSEGKWIIYKYGHAHALFCAIKFGQNFIILAVVRAIIANKAIISKYFVQRLLLHFGKFDKDLVALKMEYNNNSGRANNNSFQQNIPWANDLGITVCLYILRVAAEQFDINGFVMQGAIIMLFSPASTTNWAPPKPEEAFLQILNESLEEFLHKCLIELFQTFRLDKRLKKTDVLDFLYSLIDKDHEKVFFKAMNFDLENRSDDNNNTDAEITDLCFKDILMKRVNVDVLVQQRNKRKYILSEQLEHNNFKEINDAFKYYFDTIKFFKPSHLKIIKQATHVDIIVGLRQYLTELFMQQSRVSANYSDNMDIDNISTFTQKRKRYDLELNDWYNEIIKLHDDLNSFSMSGEFSEFLKNILELINGSNFALSRDLDEIDNQRESK